MRFTVPSLAAIALGFASTCSPAPESSARASPAIELVRTTRGVELDEPHAHTIEITADGTVALDGARVDGSDKERLRLLLNRVAGLMRFAPLDPDNLGLGRVPDEWLTLRIDRRAPFERVVPVLQVCELPDVGIRKLAFAVLDPRDSRELYLLELAPFEVGVSNHNREPRETEPPPGTASIELSVFPDEELRGSGEAHWTLEQIQPSPKFGRVSLRDWTAFARVLDERARFNQVLWLALAVDPERPWCDVIGLRELLTPYDVSQCSWYSPFWMEH